MSGGFQLQISEMEITGNEAIFESGVEPEVYNFGLLTSDLMVSEYEMTPTQYEMYLQQINQLISEKLFIFKKKPEKSIELSVRFDKPLEFASNGMFIGSGFCFFIVLKAVVRHKGGSSRYVSEWAYFRDIKTEQPVTKKISKLFTVLSKDEMIESYVLNITVRYPHVGSDPIVNLFKWPLVVEVYKGGQCVNRIERASGMATYAAELDIPISQTDIDKISIVFRVPDDIGALWERLVFIRSGRKTIKVAHPIYMPRRLFIRYRSSMDLSLPSRFRKGMIYVLRPWVYNVLYKVPIELGSTKLAEVKVSEIDDKKLSEMKSSSDIWIRRRADEIAYIQDTLKSKEFNEIAYGAKKWAGYACTTDWICPTLAVFKDPYLTTIFKNKYQMVTNIYAAVVRDIEIRPNVIVRTPVFEGYDTGQFLGDINFLFVMENFSTKPNVKQYCPKDKLWSQKMRVSNKKKKRGKLALLIRPSIPDSPALRKDWEGVPESSIKTNRKIVMVELSGKDVDEFTVYGFYDTNKYQVSALYKIDTLVSWATIEDRLVSKDTSSDIFDIEIPEE